MLQDARGPAGPDGRAGRLEGGIVSSSRALIFPEDGAASRDAAGWERAIDAAVADAARALADAAQEAA